MKLVHALLGALAALAPAALPAAAKPPKLIVALSVDQYAAALFDRYRPTYTGGLARLARGVTFTGYQSHAATETCPGHSTILTGRHPAATGIVANTWIDRRTGTSVYCVSVPGADKDARGGQNMRVDTLGDWLKRAQPGARSVAISGKDRAAITMGGHHADAVYWWGDGEGFVTSSYAGPATPAVTEPARAFSQALFARWRQTPPKLWPALPSACTALQQPVRFGELALSGNVPPDGAKEAASGPDFLTNRVSQAQLRASPLFDTIVADFAIDTIGRLRLGRGPATDMLAVSLSATDYVGHRYGGGGPEMCGQMAALDATVGRLLKRLDRLHVPYQVVLTADHGGTDAAERQAANGIDAKRLDTAAFMRELNGTLRRQLGLSIDPLIGDADQPVIVASLAGQRARIRDAALAWLRQRPEVEAAFSAEEVAAAVPPPGKPVTELTLPERFNESYDPERSGDIQVAFHPNTSFGVPRKPGDTVAGHGSPWDSDRRVPILFWRPGVRPDARTEPAETVDIAPTLAAIAGVPTDTTDGRCLPAVTDRCPAR